MRGGSPAIPRAHVRLVFEEPHIALVKDQAPVHDVLPGPTQVPEGFIATLVLQDTMARILRYFYGLE